MGYKDLAKEKEYQTNYRTKKKEQLATYQIEYVEDLKQHAINSIAAGEIIETNKWDLWCNRIKKSAKNKKHPYSKDFTNDDMFKMMIQGCFYCGELATTIDRKVSNLDHISDNCVASCYSCNNSKGAADSNTFIRKAYYRARREYVDDITDIWFVHKNKPRLNQYKLNAEKKGVAFNLTTDIWDILITGVCEYCHRSPTTWFGIDRVKPSLGYVNDNVVSCCFDCNIDTHVSDHDTMMIRNKKIADRVDIRELVIEECEQVFLHKGVNKTSKKVCVYGKVYTSKSDASRANEKGINYIGQCIRDKRYSDVVFEISDDFYNFMIDNKFENITKKMYLLFTRM